MFEQISLSEVEEIRRLHDEFDGCLQTALSKGIEEGGKLEAAKAKLDHGQWLPFLEYVGISDETARKYRLLWQHREKLNSNSGWNLARAYREILPPPAKRTDEQRAADKAVERELAEIKDKRARRNAPEPEPLHRSKKLLGENASDIEIDEEFYKCFPSLIRKFLVDYWRPDQQNAVKAKIREWVLNDM